MGIEVKCTVRMVEIDGNDVGVGDKRPPLLVVSHWNNEELVVLKLGDKSYTVAVKDIQAAIQNATHTARY